MLIREKKSETFQKRNDLQSQAIYVDKKQSKKTCTYIRRECEWACE